MCYELGNVSFNLPQLSKKLTLSLLFHRQIKPQSYKRHQSSHSDKPNELLKKLSPKLHKAKTPL